MRAMKLLFVAGVVAVAVSFVHGQSPAPIVVPAASQVTAAPAAAAAPVAPNSDSFQATLKMLQAMKEKNAETLQKQEAALQRLDELQQAAEQLRIYAKRG
jgi:ribulose kinase